MKQRIVHKNFSTLCRPRGGIKMEIMKNIYGTHVRSIGEYGSAIGSTCAEKNNEKIYKHQHKQLTKIVGTDWQARKDDIVKIVGEINSERRFEMQTLNFASNL